MPIPSEIILFVFLIAMAVMIARQTNLFAAAMLTGIFSLISASIFTLMDAVDVAFTEAAVGAGISTVLFLSTLVITGRKEEEKPARLYPLFIVMLTGIALLIGTLDMPAYGEPDTPLHTHVAATITANEYKAVVKASEKHKDGAETDKVGEAAPVKAVGLPNLVTSILGSYRGYDTLGETGVIFTAGIGVMLLLMGRRRDSEERDAAAAPLTSDAADEVDGKAIGEEDTVDLTLDELAAQVSETSDADSDPAETAASDATDDERGDRS